MAEEKQYHCDSCGHTEIVEEGGEVPKCPRCNVDMHEIERETEGH